MSFLLFMIADSCRLLEEDVSFKNNIRVVLKEFPQIWGYDAHKDIVAVVAEEKKTSESKRICAVFNGDGEFQYEIPLDYNKDEGMQNVRITDDALFLSQYMSGKIIRVDRETKEKKVFGFPKGVHTFEVDKGGRIWFLYGGYNEYEGRNGKGIVVHDAGAPQKLGSIKLDEITEALVKVEPESIMKIIDEVPPFYRFSTMTRSIDGYAVVYDPKARKLFDAETRQTQEIDCTRDYRLALCLQNNVVLMEPSDVPHDKTAFATFFVYKREEGWNTYSANVAGVFFTERVRDGSFWNARVMDGNSFIVETKMQGALAKYRLPQELVKLKS